jgi:hypothetical protein
MEMKTHSLSWLIGISALVAAGDCAAQTAASLSPQQSALIRSTCENIMRVGQTIDFDVCTASLSDSLVTHQKSYAFAQIDRACSDQGLVSGTAAYATCVLDRKRQYANSPTPVNVAGPSPAPTLTYHPSDSEDYYHMTFDTKRRREQDSCAQLGLDPDSGELQQCVAALDASLYNSDHRKR